MSKVDNGCTRFIRRRRTPQSAGHVDRRAAFSRPIERQIFKTWTQEFFILRFIILHWQTTGLSSFSSLSILNSRTRLDER
ncbi:hypothetical protein LSAT2_002719 [Lamellibrachia satsuma]|nr:hypothetical protein LSAT2_002719 [Lamellibrachia satsuma]